jgi:mycothiol system anti-sigma-R factor
MTFDCQETKLHVHEYLHNELNEVELREITAHLANCDSCESDYDLEQYVNVSIQDACSEVPPQELAERVLGNIRKMQAGIGHN